MSRLMAGVGPDGAEVAVRTDAEGNVATMAGAVAPGELQQFGVIAGFNGGVGATVSATGVVSATPRGVYRLRCITAGTITLHDNASAASGANIGGVSAQAMTAGQVIEIGELTSAGVFATVASGTYRLVLTV